MRKITFVSIFISLILLFAMNANATTITGVVSDQDGNTQIDGVDIGTKVGDKYEYYIPLGGDVNIDGVYGVDSVALGTNNYGEFQDFFTINTGDLDPNNNDIDGPLMTMFFTFDIASGHEGKSVSLWTDDLDLTPTNDPTDYFERLFIFSDIVNGANIGDSYEDYVVLDSFANVTVNPDPLGLNSSQNAFEIVFDGLSIQSGSYTLGIGFEAFSNGLADGQWSNIPELISATMTIEPVPEPSTIALLGIGLVGLAGRAARRKWKKKAVNKG